MSKMKNCTDQHSTFLSLQQFANVYLIGTASPSALSMARDNCLNRVMPDTMFGRNPPRLFAQEMYSRIMPWLLPDIVSLLSIHVGLLVSWAHCSKITHRSPLTRVVAPSASSAAYRLRLRTVEEEKPLPTKSHNLCTLHLFWPITGLARTHQHAEKNPLFVRSRH